MNDSDTQTPLDEQIADAIPAEDNGHEPTASIIDGVRAMREAKLSDDVRQLDLDIPGYEGKLAVIYRYPESGYQRAVKALERGVEEKTPLARVEAAADLLALACAAVVGRNDEGALIDPVSNALLGERELPENLMRFDRKLAAAVGIDVAPDVKTVGRLVVRSLFSPRGAATGVYEGDLALISQSNVVFAWLNGAEIKADDEVLGE